MLHLWVLETSVELILTVFVAAEISGGCKAPVEIGLVEYPILSHGFVNIPGG